MFTLPIYFGLPGTNNREGMLRADPGHIEAVLKEVRDPSIYIGTRAISHRLLHLCITSSAGSVTIQSLLSLYYDR